MDSNINKDKRGTNPNIVKFCSINICGLSERSQFMLDKYVEDNKITVLSVQETSTIKSKSSRGTQKSIRQLKNMLVYQDTNNETNNGCAIFVQSDVSFTQLKDISQISKEIDSVWGVLQWGNKRFVIGNVYLKLDYIQGVSEVKKMLVKASNAVSQHKCAGVLLMGDFNARHQLWNDHTENLYGKKLQQELDFDHFCIEATMSPTFLAKGYQGSIIDFFIVSTKLDSSIMKVYADYNAHLYSGAPERGHVPVTLELATHAQKTETKTETKYDLKSMKWEDWKKDIEKELISNSFQSMMSEKDAEKIFKSFEEVINESTKANCDTKRVCQHSKPYWTKELTELSKSLRDCQKKYLKQNTDDNFKHFKDAKQTFEDARKSACQNFITDQTKNLNAADSTRFWKQFQRMFKPPSDQRIDALTTGDGTIISENEDIEKSLFTTFFEGRHIEENKDNFDVPFHSEVSSKYDDIRKNEYKIEDFDNPIMAEESKQLYKPITFQEVVETIKNNKSSAASFDNHEFHPQMLKNLGYHGMDTLTTLFNILLEEGNWIWNSAKVVFLKKEGKSTYSDPGSYRPISLSSYIGKVLERILTSRLESYLINAGYMDQNQEGFSKGRNTVRYLNRLTTGIKGDVEKKYTVLCLFVDFEKAFDSVWKKGLIVKLWEHGVHGPFLGVINEFLMNREVTLVVNGFYGPTRLCGDIGLPQGSCLSPTLFKFYVSDMESAVANIPQVKFFKFADDGTAQVTASTLEECLFYFNMVLEAISEWTGYWRLVVNCRVNKTEVICFNSSTPNLVPTTFKLGNKEIRLVNHSKVLGITLDEKLNYKEHSRLVYNKLLFKWVTVCRYSSRKWGMNLSVILQILKVIISSSLFYGGIVWMNSTNIADINSIWYKVIKSAIGAIYYPHQAIAEVIVGVAPLLVTNKINTVKHYLKVILEKPPSYVDIHASFIENELEKGRNTAMQIHMKEVFKFLLWKLELVPEQFLPQDSVIIKQKDFSKFNNLSHDSCRYSKGLMKSYTEVLWQDSLKNQLQNEGWVRFPKVSTIPLKIPLFTSRTDEVLLLSLFYKNNLLNDFLFRMKQIASPLCMCQKDEQTAFHLVTSCPLVESELRNGATEIMNRCNEVSSDNELLNDHISLLNSSRDPDFIHHCLKIVKTKDLKLRKEITLRK